MKKPFTQLNLSSIEYVRVEYHVAESKRQCHEIFNLSFFHQTIPSKSLIHALKYFQISLRIRREINKYVLARPICGIALGHGPALCRIVLDFFLKEFV
jgi:hypothetical protein